MNRQTVNSKPLPSGLVGWIEKNWFPLLVGVMVGTGTMVAVVYFYVKAKGGAL